MTRLLITGGSSYLGQSLVPLAQSQHDVFYTYFHHNPWPEGRGAVLDLRQAAAVAGLVDDWQPDVIVHLAGSNRAPDMTAVIEQGTANIARAATAAGARLIHLSTDSIFDGRSAPYAESVPPSPLNEYGRAKATAEAIVRRQPDHLIIRTSLIYDPARVDHSTAWIVDALRRREPVTLFTNQLRNPVAAGTLASAILELFDAADQGVLNVAGGQVLSRAAFGQRLLDWWGWRDRTTLRLGENEDGRWPADTTLDISRATSRLRTPLPGVDAVLAAATPPNPLV